MNLEKGSILISEPFIEDPNFKRSVVLLVEHNEEGSVGFVLNQRTDLAVNMVMEELSSVTTSLFQGGPVEQDRLNYIHTREDIEGSDEILPGIYFGGQFEHILTALDQGIYNTKEFKFFIGYSGWAPGQLASEIEEKSWIVASLNSQDIIDHDLIENDLWKKAIQRSGGKNILLANSPDAPYLN
jgi:putative transcriptional regulator